MWAAWHNHERTVSLLIDRGADINSKNRNGETALMKAEYQGNANILMLLVKYGADIYAAHQMLYLIFIFVTILLICIDWYLFILFSLLF